MIILFRNGMIHTYNTKMTFKNLHICIQDDRMLCLSFLYCLLCEINSLIQYLYDIMYVYIILRAKISTNMITCNNQTSSTLMRVSHYFFTYSNPNIFSTSFINQDNCRVNNRESTNLFMLNRVITLTRPPLPYYQIGLLWVKSNSCNGMGVDVAFNPNPPYQECKVITFEKKKLI